VAEIQRAQQRQRRQQVAAQRSAATAQRQRIQAQEQAYRAAQREAARGHKAAMAAYQQAREAEITARNALLDGRIAQLGGLLLDGLHHRPFAWDQLHSPARIPPFEPGPLGQPVRFPDQRAYAVPAPSGLQALNPNAKRNHEARVAQERARFEYDWHQAQAAEADRQNRLAAYYQQYQAWAAGLHQEAAQRQVQLDEWRQRVAQRDPQAVQEYFSAALHSARAWPDDFPWQFELGYDPSARQLLIRWQLPSTEIVPAITRFRYVKSTDREIEVARPVTERRELSRQVLAQCALRVLACLVAADGQQQLLASIAFSGFVHQLDPATGYESDTYLVTVTCRGEAVAGLALDRVEPVSCLLGLKGQLSAHPERLDAVRPGRLPEILGGALSRVCDDEDPDLYSMDPVEFEELIADLFRLRGLQVTTTARSGDQGVDVRAIDPDPITGGEIVIQAKRYRHTVSPDAVRDLWGTVDHFRAAKGILVTTSGFGPGSHEFAHDKRLTLIDGRQLVGLLNQAGLPGHLGSG
jgi:restriction system protein